MSHKQEDVCVVFEYTHAFLKIDKCLLLNYKLKRASW